MGIPDGSPDDLARDNLDPEVMRYLMEECLGMGERVFRSEISFLPIK